MSAAHVEGHGNGYPSAGHRYLSQVGALIDRLSGPTWTSIETAAELIANSMLTGGTLHAFGTGHSHMLAEELFYRAGGLVAVKPILFSGLMLHDGARRSTEMERLPGLADVLLGDHPVAQGDVLLMASNSGGNVVCVELARAAQAAGVRVVAITSLAHATSPQARARGTTKLHEIADVVIDNGGVPGDAILTVAGSTEPVGPTSTVVGAAIVNAMVAEVVERMTRAGSPPALYRSANLAGGDATNAAWEDIERAGQGGTA